MANFFLLTTIFVFNVSAQEGLVLIGGENCEPEVISHFVEWAGKEKFLIYLRESDF